MAKDIDSLIESREIRKKVIQKYGDVPTSVWEIDYSWGKHVIEYEKRKQQKVAQDKHKKMEYDKNRLSKAFEMSSQNVRGKSGGLSTFPPALAHRIVMFYSDEGDTILDPCIAGDTLIATVDGDVPIKKLVGKTPYVYCYGDGRIRVRRADNIRKTKEYTSVLKVVLDTYAVIYCTPEHKFMLRSGEYKEAGKLKENDSLMPFYKRLDHENRYWVSLNNGDARKQSHLVYCDVHNENLDTKTHCIHHKDNNQKNDNPDNLEKLTYEQHKKTYKRDGENNNFYGKRHSVESKKKIGARFHNHKVRSVSDCEILMGVYNMNVDEYHNYVANGVVIKNCAGHNSRMQVVHESGRNYIGYDVSKDFIEFNKEVRDEILGKGKQNILFESPNTIVLHEASSEKMVEETESIDLVFTCYDEKTEVMTDNGFKFFDDVLKTDKVATLSKEGNLIFELPNEVQKYRHKGEMINFTNKRGVDLMVTPNHNMWVRKRHWDKYKLIPATDVRLQDRVMRHSKWIGNDHKTFVLPSIVTEKNHVRQPVEIDMKDWMAFLGWYISEGWCYHKDGKKGSNYSVNICQKDTSVLEDIGEMMNKYGFKYTIKDTTMFIRSKQLYVYLKPLGHSHEKYIPYESRQLSKPYIKCLLNSLLLGDGNGRNLYFTSSKLLADHVSEIAMKVGLCSTVMLRKNNGKPCFIKGREIKSKRQGYIVVLSSPVERSITSIKKTKHDGYVHCCTVSTGVIFVRRNGKTSWCGNSPPYWDIEFYGEEKEQMGYKHTYPEFLEIITRVVGESHRVLKKGRYCAFNINDFRKNGKFYPYHADLMKIFEDVGFSLWDCIIIKWKSAIGACFASQVEERKICAKSHEYLIVGRKNGDDERKKQK